MNWYDKIRRIAQLKTLYIIRGLSGSGKSTLANELGKEGVVISSDDYFMEDGEYKWDPEKLKEAHGWSLGKVKEAMQKGISPIVLDNTHVQAWEMKPAVELALEYDYNIEFSEPNTPWKFNPEELAKRNKHGVPQEKIEEKLSKWDTNVSLEHILDSEKPIDPS
jgi:predicted kinase